MFFLKKFGKALLYSLIIILGLTLIVTIFNYFNIISYQLVNIIKIITIILAFLLGGIIVGKKSTNKAWLEGIKLSLIIIFLLSIFNLIFFKNGVDWKDLIYFLIISFTTILGSILGINFKREKKSTM